MQTPKKPTQKEISKMIMIAYFGPRKEPNHIPYPTDEQSQRALLSILMRVEEHIRNN